MMSSHPYELARRYGGGVILAGAPARVRWELADLPTADGHFLSAQFSASLRPINDATELKMLEESLLNGRNAVNVHDVELHYAAALQSAAREAARGKSVDHWLAEPGRTAMCELLKKTAESISFSCGLEVLGPVRAEIDSPTLTQQQMQAMTRTLAEQQAAGRVEHFQKAAELLSQFQSKSGAISREVVGHAIDSLSPPDRGGMLKTLLLAGSSKAQSSTLWAIAGTALVRIDLVGSSAPTAIDLPAALGPLRSVQVATIDEKPLWLIGARDGVMTIAEPGREEPTLYRDAAVETAQGFSRAIIHRGRLIACHGDAGLIAWNLDQPGRPDQTLRPAELGGSPRHLHVLDGKCVVFAVGTQLVALKHDGSLQPLGAAGPAPIIAIVPDGGRLIVVYEDATLRALERSTRAIITLERRGRKISAATALPWLGGNRLLLAGDDGAIDCVGADDDLLSQYVSTHRGARRVVASTSHVAALSGDRLRVIVWNAWDGKAPQREISLVGVTPHRIADLLLM